MLAVWALGLGWPGAVRAFSTADRFAVDAAAGGGGNRHFTGSLADGFTCAVCHQGGAPVRWRILGIPDDSYEPGRLYDIALAWDGPVAKAAAAIEWLDRNGRATGEVNLVPEAERSASEFCTDPTAPFPARSYQPSAERWVMAMDACGATALRVRWRAPSAQTGPVWVHAVHVRGDDSGSAVGDGFVRFARVLQPQASEPVTVEGGCQLTRRAPPGAPLASLCWLVISVGVLCRRRSAIRT
ncbi:MAG: hypothetical protein ACPGUV_13650 [Polyangiales bacterium]